MWHPLAFAEAASLEGAVGAAAGAVELAVAQADAEAELEVEAADEEAEGYGRWLWERVHMVGRWGGGVGLHVGGFEGGRGRPATLPLPKQGAAGALPWQPGCRCPPTYLAAPPRLCGQLLSHACRPKSPAAPSPPQIAGLPHVRVTLPVPQPPPAQPPTAQPPTANRTALLMLDSGATGCDVMLHERAARELGLLASGPSAVMRG